MERDFVDFQAESMGFHEIFDAKGKTHARFNLDSLDQTQREQTQTIRRVVRWHKGDAVQKGNEVKTQLRGS